MPTEKTRITITLDDDLASKIDDYRFANRQKNQTQAIVSLIKKGFASIPDDSEKTEKTSMLEGTEVSISVEESTALLVELGYIQPGQQLTDQDLAILTLISYVMDNWFSREKP